MCGITATVALDANRHDARASPEDLAADAAATNGNITDKAAASRRAHLEKDLLASLEKIAHRGPDAQGTWTSPEGHVGLGHCRLAINDLSPSGSQPFHSPSNKVHAVVNGELYDHDRIRQQLIKDFSYPFKSTSDGEIVIALYQHYGLSFLNQLRGEFAIVLYDDERRLFLAARDRYGIKPLFWTTDADGKLCVSAEMKAFLPLGWQPEWDVRSLVDAGWGHDARTIFKGVQKVRPGHYITCSPFGFIESRQYWDMEYPDKFSVNTMSEAEMVEGVRQRLLDAVRLRLRADVPVGIYLSGGIDSSVIAGMATHLVKEQGLQMGSQDPKSRICCFSIAFDDSDYDESDISNRTAQWLGVRYLKKLMTEEELANRLEDATYHSEHHYLDLNYIGKFALSELVRENDYKVVLTGEGADENFGGYPLYQPDYLREPDPSWPDNPLNDSNILRQQLQVDKEDQIAQTYIAIGGDAGNRATSLASKQLHDITTSSSMLAFNPSLKFFAPWVRQLYQNLDPRETVADNVDNRTKTLIQERWHPLHSAQYIWTKGHLANSFLSCLGDRTEMAHSVEARTPFLDHHLTAYANACPPSLKIKYLEDSQATVGATAPNEVDTRENKRRRQDDSRKGTLQEKYLLREASRPFITDELYRRTKHPYSAATFYPIDGPLHRKFKEIITKENVEKLGFLDWGNVEPMLGNAFDDSLREDQRAKAMRTVLIVCQWCVLGERFGVKTAGLQGGMGNRKRKAV